MAPGSAARPIDLEPVPTRQEIGLRRRARRVTTRDLRRALLHRAADAIAVLGRDGAAFNWRPHESRDYHARSSFAIAEVLATALGRAVPDLALRAERTVVMSRWIDDEAARTTIAAYWCDAPDRVPLPIYIAGESALAIAEALDLGLVAVDALRAAGHGDARCELVLGGFDACSRAVAAWSANGVVYVARLDGPSAIERMLAGWQAVTGRA
jgi:hypothetical protein